MNKTILKVIEQSDYDRYVFLTYQNNRAKFSSGYWIN